MYPFKFRAKDLISKCGNPLIDSVQLLPLSVDRKIPSSVPQKISLFKLIARLSI